MSWRFAAAAVGLVLFVGCATDIPASSQPAAMNTQGAGRVLFLQNQISLDLPHGYSVDDVPPNTQWRQVGTIPQGQVLEAVNYPMVVKVGPKYKCDLVIHQDGLMGIYIPSYSAFVSADSPAYAMFLEAPAAH